MATFDQLKEVRLTIADPPGFIDFLEVANFAALPVTPVAQTGYKAVDTATYYGHNGTAYVALTLMVSDARISGWIDALGVPGAVRKSIEAIVAQLPAQLQIVKNDSGTESNEFIKLLDLQKFYQNWLKDLTPPDTSVNTGKYFKTVPACIAGGNL
jgi:hypothetical protein